MKDVIYIVDVDDIVFIIKNDISLSKKEITVYVDNVMYNVILSLLHNLGYVVHGYYKDILIHNRTYIEDLIQNRLKSTLYNISIETILTLRTVVINGSLHIILTKG